MDSYKFKQKISKIERKSNYKFKRLMQIWNTTIKWIKKNRKFHLLEEEGLGILLVSYFQFLPLLFHNLTQELSTPMQ